MNYYTKEQLEKIFQSWGMNHLTPPTKKKDVVIVWPGGHSPNFARVKKTEFKSTYGKTLYSIEFKTV